MPTSHNHHAARLTPRVVFVASFLALAALALWGALQLEFQCDDAFIAFRYVSNAHLGHGLVWNPEPFAPVEGYTCFSWVLCLWAMWSWFGIEPPVAANVLSISFGLLLFVVTARTALRILDRNDRPLSNIVVLTMLLMVAGNRTFLTWWTSGLETALFNLAFVSWVVLAFRARSRRSTAWATLWSSAAALCALTRPDGLLIVAATTATLVWTAAQDRKLLRSMALAALPLLAVVTHLLWRRSFYGEWLPNTYYAKVTTPWPEAGLRYLAAFIFEHGAWLWLPIGLVWAIAELRRGLSQCTRALLANVPAVAAVGTLVVHVSYYVLRVGGDPFEYRIFSHLVPLGALAVLATMARVTTGSVLPMTASLAVGIASSVGWIQMALAEPNLTPFYQPTFRKVPGFAQPIARWYDRNQAWLQLQVLCGRRELHAMFLAQQRRELPERQRRTVNQNDLPVTAFRGVGLAGWVLPDVAVLDLLGLNDWTVAHMPVNHSAASLLPQPVVDALFATADKNGDGQYTTAELHDQLLQLPGVNEGYANGLAHFLVLLFAQGSSDYLTLAETTTIAPFFANIRFMAHERLAPKEYIDQLAPNVTVVDREVIEQPRQPPLTSERVRQIEAEWRERVRTSKQ